MKYVIYNHRLIEREKIKIPIDDRSFRFGDGCFETVLFRNATCFYLDKHLDRLKKSLSLLSIQLDITSIADEILRLIDANKIRDGILRVIVSRGISSSGYLPVKSIPYYLIETVPNQFQTPDKVSLFVSKWRKPAAESIPVHAKYSANINSILARIEANENNCFESLQLTSDGFISECSSANIAWIKDDRLFSPSDECDCLAGITLSIFDDLLKQSIHFGKYQLADVLNADEIILLNSAWGILPVDIIAQHRREYTKTKSQAYIQLFNQHINDYCN